MQDIEELKKAIVEILQQKIEFPFDQTIHDWKIKNLSDQVQIKSIEILKFFKEKTLDFQQEISELNNQDSFNNFESQIQFILNQQDNSIQKPNNATLFLEQVFQPPNQFPQFSPNENKGKTLDLQPIYDYIINNKDLYQIFNFQDFFYFIRDFEQIFEPPLYVKKQYYKQFKNLFQRILDYFIDYFKKTQPLVDFDKLINQIQEEFFIKYHNKQIEGYFDDIQQEEYIQQEQIDKTFDIEIQGFYCNICQKQLENKNNLKHHLQGKIHLKKLKIQNNKIEYEQKIILIQDKQKFLAFKEYQILQLKQLLQENFEKTINNLRLIQTQDQIEEQQSEINSIKSEEEKNQYVQHKNLPLGWDGKPIPLWLYKLHGLGIEYKCEICGNTSYWGRRTFEKHFSEWRHQFGLKALKIPNSDHFKFITSINDAIILHKKLLLDSKKQQFQENDEEQCEDSEGNVYKKQDYLDLKAEGIID